jgi:hypothetical protein
MVSTADPRSANAGFRRKSCGCGESTTLAEIVCRRLSAVAGPIQAPVQPIIEPARLIVSLVS